MAHSPVHETTTAAVSLEKLRDRLRRRPSDPSTLRRASPEPRTMTRTRLLRYLSHVLQIGLAIALAAAVAATVVVASSIASASRFRSSKISRRRLNGRKRPAGPP
ncbi:hypothetical protein ALC56_09347 [Trachymyrmex septentrionalis]|uniref:Uncharacterized protein n=1 Tax=Trachymyrmex septentrionalis TaxID=34720 RepID=A0A195F872_9HYME|nr:hypothetical protein ALC56_09347 [Trachymyrmex septentrionalis]